MTFEEALHSRAPHAAATVLPEDESGWLIERGDLKPETIAYFCFVKTVDHGVEIKHWRWTKDHLRAARFARKIDAEMLWECLIGRSLEEVDIVEHGWDAHQPPHPSKADTQKEGE